MKLDRIIVFLVFGTLAFSVIGQTTRAGLGAYLNWTADQAERVGKEMRKSGQVGKSLDFRIIHTERAINYKLRATLMTPDVIRASARVEQFRNRLTDEQTRDLVEEAEAGNHLVVVVELDPREGSGVIPLDWRVFLQPAGLRLGDPGSIPGIKAPELRSVKALTGVYRRDYDYDIFWVTFPLVDKNGNATISSDVQEIELLVGIYGNEGRVSWKLPESLRDRITALARKKNN